MDTTGIEHEDIGATLLTALKRFALASEEAPPCVTIDWFSVVSKSFHWSPALLNRNALCEISRLIYIAPAHDCCVICQ